MKASSRKIIFASAVLLIMFQFPNFIDYAGSRAGLVCEAATGAKGAKAAGNSQSSQADPPGKYGSREMMEKEEALSLKERELKNMSSKLDARMKELDEKRRSLESSISAGNKANDEKYKKMIKLYKSLQPEEAAALIGKLDEDTAFEMLNKMDTKTAAKLVPFLNQKMVLKWTRLTLKGN